ncbi:MAG: ABC transporter permease [Cytophagaceae bacterium]|nr:ABC transporter permease [Gemmatimonadaceae bacterium]
MSRDTRERIVTRLYRGLLHLYPESFRQGYGDDMAETFIDGWREARRGGTARALTFTMRAMLDALLNGARERLHDTTPRSRMLYWQDVRYATRLLLRSPGFTLLTVVVLGGGLALSIFTYSFLHTAMLRPLPLGEGAGIVRVMATRGVETQSIDAVALAEVRRGATTLTHMGAYRTRDIVVGRADGRRVVDATETEPNLFQLTRTPAAMGRTLLPADAEPGAEPVIVLSWRTWEVAFGTDSSVVNSRVDIDGVPTRVVGVMPPGYGFPVASETWIPLPNAVLATTEAGTTSFDVYARLRAGVTAAAAQTEVGTLMARAMAAIDTTSSARTEAVSAAIQSFPMAQMGETGPLFLAILNGLATLILLLALVNVTNLLLARANERVRETAVRLALGASRARLLAQGMWESVLICLMGGALGTVLATWGLRAITTWTRAHLERNMAFWWVWDIDRTTLLAAGGFITVSIAAVGGIVAMRAAATNVNAVLQDGGTRSGSRRDGRLARALVATQVSTVTVLMFFGVMAGLVARRVVTFDPGYDTHNLLQTSIAPEGSRYASATSRRVLYQSVVDGMAQWPEVDGVLLRAGLAEIRSAEGAFELAGRAVTPTGAPTAHVQGVLGTLGALGIRIEDGRPFDARDAADMAPVVLLSRALAARHWPGQSPIGQQVRLPGLPEATAWRTVVGVASDVPLGNPLARNRSADAIYLPLSQADANGVSVIFRHRGSAVAAREALNQVVASVDPLLVPSRVQTHEEVQATMGMITVSVARLFAACFGFALLLAVSGTYGLMARAIWQRSREIGVRRALGATDASITRLLLTQGGRQLGVGALVALPLMLVIGAGFTHFFPVAYALAATAGALVTLAIIGVVLLATWVPTRRVLRMGTASVLGRE